MDLAFATSPRRVHLLEPDHDARRYIEGHVTRMGHGVHPQPRASDALAYLLSNRDPVMLDMGYSVDAVTFLRDLRAAGFREPVVVVALSASVPVAVSMMKAGADDFHLRPVDYERMYASLFPSHPARLDPVTILAQRMRLGDVQVRVLRLMAEGITNKETGSILHISPKTSERHRTAILRKLGLRNSAQVAKLVAGLASGSIVDFAAPEPTP